MTNLIETPVYESSIFQLETTTPVLGGQPGFNLGVPTTGHSNAQAQQLANRTAFLNGKFGDLANNSDPTKGSALIGIMGMNLSTYLKEIRVPIEAFGAVGDFNPTTLVGTNNNTAFNLAKASGLKIQLKPGANYMYTGDLVVYDYMDWSGDSTYSSTISCKPSASGVCAISAPLTGPTIKKVTLKGFTVARVGAFAEHGVLLDNIDGLESDLRVISNGAALGGAYGVSAFYPRNRPSTKCNVKAVIEYGGNFGLQFGNVDDGSMEVISDNTMREVIGIEPYALGRYNFTQTQVAADAITWPSHGLTAGYPLLYANLGNAGITPLSRPDYWFAIIIDTDTIKLAASKEQALAGVALTLGAVAGTQAFLKCGISRNINVLPSRITVGDVPMLGSLTGLVDITSASGGYHEGISLSPITVIERNPTSGNHGLLIGGAHNITVNDFQATGCKLTGVLIDASTVNAITDATGNITPSPALSLRPMDVTVDSAVVREFLSVGVRVRNGKVLVRMPYANSNSAGAIGIQVEANAETLGSRVVRGTVDCPNGTGLSMTIFGDNRDVNVESIRDRKIVRVESQSLYKTIVGAPANVCGVSDQSGGVTTYAGQLYITARSSTFSSANIAAYWLDVMLSNSGGTPTVSVVKSSGLVAGGGASHPSFTFSISGNNLVATPIGSTSTASTWYFYIHALGDIALS